MKESELTNALSAITPEAGLEQRILRRVSVPASRPIRTLRRTAVALVAAAMVLTVGVFASNPEVWMWSGHTGIQPSYTALPTDRDCRENLGFVPQLVERFDNGYTFEKASIGSNKLTDKGGKVLSQFKDLNITYTKDGHSLLLNVYRSNPLTQSTGTLVTTVEGIDLLMSSYNNKLVPERYQLTAEDEAAKANGELVFSYGSDRVEIFRVDTLSWQQDGLQYVLQQMDSSLTPEELTAMAAQLITK